MGKRGDFQNFIKKVNCVSLGLFYIMKKCTFPFIVVFLFTINVFGQTDHVGSGRAIRFDGVNDLIDLGNIYDDLTFPFSVSAWVYMDPGNTIPGPIMVSQDNNPLYNGFWFFVGPNMIFIEYGDGRGENLPEYRKGKSATGLNLNGRWVHAAAVVKGISNIELYINGINVGGNYQGSSDLAMASMYPADIAKIGYFLSNSVTYRFNGIIDELRVYNTALTENDIRDTMCKRLNGNEAGLIGYWDFDETSGNTVFDRSTRGFNGTLIGSPQRVFSGAPVGNNSVRLYRNDWSGVKFQLEDGVDKVEVSNITGNPQGIQIYEVLDLPTQRSGLPATISQPYFGVFAATLNSAGAMYDVNYTSQNAACKLFVRKDNSVSTWNERTNPLTSVNTRTEIIKQTGAANSFDVELGNDRLLCDQSSTSLSTAIDPSQKVFLWSTGEKTASINVTQSGTYSVAVSQECFTDRDTIVVQFVKTPLPFSFGEDKLLCSIEPFVLKTLQDTVGLTLTWQDNSNKTSYTVTKEGLYWLKKENACGVATASVEVRIADLTDYKIPNVITPNDDPLNQYFVLHPLLLGSSLAVYNRWGKQVFSSSNYQNEWDGYDLPTGVYFYTLSGQCIPDRKGTVHIVR